METQGEDVVPGISNILQYLLLYKGLLPKHILYIFSYFLNDCCVE